MSYVLFGYYSMISSDMMTSVEDKEYEKTSEPKINTKNFGEGVIWGYRDP